MFNKDKINKKKKSLRRKKQEGDFTNFSEDDEENETHLSNLVSNVNAGGDLFLKSLDAKLQSVYDLSGKKGHSNFHSMQNISLGVYYFEVEIISLEYNIHEYITTKRIDEFSKKYYENILHNIKAYMPSVRIGFVNSSGDLDLAIGAEKYSYAYRADGMIINDGEYKENNSFYNKGDCIGALIQMKPPRPDFLKNVNDKNSENNNECYVKYFKNGVEQKEVFIGIHEGSYHAAITLYNFAKASINFGPNFKFLSCLDNRSVRSFGEVEY